MIDDARAAFSVCDGRDPTANADGRGRRVDGRGALMTELPANEAKRALGQRDRHLTGPGRGVVDELIDYEIAVRTDVECCLVGEQDLQAPAGGRLNSLLVDDSSPYIQNLSFSARWRTVRLRINRGSCPNLLAERRHGYQHRPGEQCRKAHCDIRA